MEHQGSVELAAVHGTRGVLEIAGEVERKDVDREYTSPSCAQRGECLLMGVVAVCGKNNESVHAALLPGAEQVVHPAVQGFAANGGIAGVGSLDRGIDAIRHDGRA